MRIYIITAEKTNILERTGKMLDVAEKGMSGIRLTL
jgi:hypothetical protein